MPSLFTPDQRAQYERDGYLIIRSLFDTEEIALMRDAIEQDPALRASLYDRKDAEGKSTRMALWNHPGDSVYGLAARSHRVVDTMEDMLGGEVYHYHSKLTAKEPYDGGAWEWHQDYGYWYHNGCMYPYMGSVMVALDRANRENGCLQVLRASHLVGRVDHGVLPGEQVGADPRRVEEMKKQLELVYVELEPGAGPCCRHPVIQAGCATAGPAPAGRCRRLPPGSNRLARIPGPAARVRQRVAAWFRKIPVLHPARSAASGNCRRRPDRRVRPAPRYRSSKNAPAQSVSPPARRHRHSCDTHHTTGRTGTPPEYPDPTWQTCGMAPQNVEARLMLAAHANPGAERGTICDEQAHQNAPPNPTEHRCHEDCSPDPCDRRADR